MSVLLEIQDGSPWWLSPNVWTVPGGDPQGIPGLGKYRDTSHIYLLPNKANSADAKKHAAD